VHGALGVGDLRICFDENDPAALPTDTLVPQTNYPGLAEGGAAIIPNQVAMRGLLQTAFAIPAANVALFEHEANKTFSCAALKALPKFSIAAATLGASGPTIVALMGCGPNTGDAQKCGPGFNPSTGNLHFVQVNAAAQISAPGSEIAAQFVDLSYSLDAQTKSNLDLQLGVLPGNCAGNPAMLNFGKASMAFTYAPAAATGFDASGLLACDANKQSLLKTTFTSMQRVTDPRAIPSTYYEARDYLFAIVGDSQQTGPQALHALAITFEQRKY